jgi:LAS superfamily LD-carboxypeptidase LdcB
MTSIGTSMVITSAFRTFAKQKELERTLKEQAAPAGSSNHGWGIAIDINELYIRPEFRKTTDKKGNTISIKRIYDYEQQQSIRKGNTYKLIASIAKKYGWYHPYLMRDNVKTDETWHFEYWGPAPGVNLTA